MTLCRGMTRVIERLLRVELFFRVPWVPRGSPWSRLLKTNIDRADAEDPTSWAERTSFTYQVAARGGIPAPANQPSPTVATHERPYTALQLKHLDNLGLWYRHHGHPFGDTPLP